jgi:hypothetical protein
MKRLRRIILLIALFVTLLLAGLLTWNLILNREPRYQDRTLTQWLEDYDNLSSGTLMETNDLAMLQTSTNALKQIGTNAIPFLLKKLSGRENAIEQRLKQWMGETQLNRLHLADHDRQRALGLDGFEVLGKEAVSAVPSLLLLTQEPYPGIRFAALESLRAINTESDTILSILRQTIHAVDKKAQRGSAEVLIELYPQEAEKAGVYKMYPELKPSLTKSVPINPPLAQ